MVASNRPMRCPEEIVEAAMNLSRRLMFLAESERGWAWREFMEAPNRTPDECERLVERHTKKAKKAVKKYLRTKCQRFADEAAEHILRARCYAATRAMLLGRKATEADLPFRWARDADPLTWAAKGGGQ